MVPGTVLLLSVAGVIVSDIVSNAFLLSTLLSIFFLIQISENIQYLYGIFSMKLQINAIKFFNMFLVRFVIVILSSSSLDKILTNWK